MKTSNNFSRVYATSEPLAQTLALVALGFILE